MNFSNSSRSWISQKKRLLARGEKKGNILKAKLCTNTALPDFNCLYQSDLDKKCGTGIQVTFMLFFFFKGSFHFLFLGLVFCILPSDFQMYCILCVYTYFMCGCIYKPKYF